MVSSDENSEIGAIEVHAPYSVILIEGGPTKDIPHDLSDNVGATGSSIAVGTLSEQDGPTMLRLLLGDRDGPDAAGLRIFDGVIDAPAGNISVRSVEGETYLALPVRTATVRLVITTNAAREPSEIDIRVFELQTLKGA